MEAPTLSDAVVTLRPHGGDRRGGGPRTLAVELDRRRAGQVSLTPDGRGAASISFALAPWARGRGAASAAVRLYLAWAFEHWARAGEGGLDVVHWRGVVGDWPSRRVAWACGFTVEGRVRGLLEHDGRRRDAWIGSVRADDDLRPANRWLEVPVVELGDVVLRPYGPDDVPRVTQACSAASTRAWLPALPAPYTEQDAREFVESREESHSRGDGVHWAVAGAGDGVLLGAVSVTGLAGGTSRGGEIGYWTHPDARGRGVMTTAVRAAARHGLHTVADGGLGLERVLVRAAAPNAASRRVAEKAGFVEVGRDRRAERLADGRVVDFVRYDLLAGELEAGGGLSPGPPLG